MQMQGRWPSCFLVSLSFITLLFCPWARAQESTVDGVADHLAEQLQKSQKKHFFPSVLVIDFPSRPGRINALGESLADQLSDALAQKMAQSTVIDRRKLHSYLQTNGISPFDLADRDIAIWIAGEVGANAIVFGSVTPSEEKLILRTDLIRIEDEKQIGSSKANLRANDQLKEMVPKPLDWPASPGVVMSCLSGSPEENGRLL